MCLWCNTCVTIHVINGRDTSLNVFLFFFFYWIRNHTIKLRLSSNSTPNDTHQNTCHMEWTLTLIFFFRKNVLTFVTWPWLRSVLKRHLNGPNARNALRGSILHNPDWDYGERCLAQGPDAHAAESPISGIWPDLDPTRDPSSCCVNMLTFTLKLLSFQN